MLNAKPQSLPVRADERGEGAAEQADRRYLALVLVKKLVLSMLVGVVAYAGLDLFSYFPAWWTKSFAFLMVFLSIRFVRLSVVLTMGALAVPLLYQSLSLGVLYLMACAMFLLLFWWLEFFPEAFLLVASTPLWASLEVMGIPLPLYFLPVFMAGVWARGAWSSVIPGIAAVFASITGVVVGVSSIGPLLIGSLPKVKFFAERPAPANIFDLGWLFGKEAGIGKVLEHPAAVVKYLSSIVTSFGLYPFMLIQIGIWMIAGYFIGKFFSMRTLVGDFVAVALGAVAAIASPIVMHVLFPQQTQAVSGSVLMYALPAALAFGLAQLERALRDAQELAERDYDKALEAHAEAEYQRALAIYNQQVAQARAEAEAHGESYEEPEPPPPPPPPQKKQVSLDNLNLQDTVKLQMQLENLMKKKFTQECTVIDVDVAGSVRLKEGAKAEAILYSFGQFHNFMDKSMEKFGGRLMDRAGDGIIYSFHGDDNADNALAAAKYALRHLEEFNRTRNKLGKDFVVRLGLNSGEIIKDENTEKGMTFSPVIDIAGHLQKAAQPNSLLISQFTFERLQERGGFVEFGKLPKNDVTAYALERL